MRYILLLIALTPAFLMAQFSFQEQQEIDSLENILQTTSNDTVRINTWKALDKVVQYKDQDLHLTLNSKIDSLSTYNLTRELPPHLVKFFSQARAYSLSSFGFYERSKGNFERSIELHSESMSIYEKIDDQNGISNALNNIGIAYGMQGEYDMSEAFVLRSLKYRKELGDKDGIANAYNNLGNINYYRGNYAKAIDYWSSSLKTKEENGDKKGMANTLNNIGNIYRAQKNYIKSEKYYTKSLKIYQDLGDREGMSVTYSNMAILFQDKGDFLLAKKFLLKSLKLSEEQENKKGIANCLNSLGSIYKEEGNFNKAIATFEKCLNLYESIGDKKGQAVALNNLGIVNNAKGNYDKALEFSNQSLELAKSIDSQVRIRDAAKILWEINKNKGNLKEALEMHELYTITKDSLESVENKMEILRQEYQYNYDKQAAADSVKAAEKAKVVNAELAAKQAESKKNKLEAKQQEQQKYFVFGGLAIALLFLIFIFNRFRITNKQKGIIEKQKQEVDKAYDTLEDKNEELEQKNKEIFDSFNYAKRIQNAILPSEKVMKQKFPNSFVFYKPKEIVAGDFYWMEERDGNVLLAACDCTGHGVPGAMVSVICVNGLNRTVREYGITEPGKILDKTKEIVMSEFEKSEDDVKDGMDIALISIQESVQSDKESDASTSLKSLTQTVLNYAGANNPLWIVRKDATEVEEIKPDKQPIGKFEHSKKFNTHSITLQKGDTFYIFSDGYADQFGGDKGKKLKAKYFKKMLLSLQHQTMDEQYLSIQQSFEEWKGDLEQVDDVCVIGVRV